MIAPGAGKWLVLMLASGTVSIAMGVWSRDWPDTILAVGVLALCSLLIAIGHDALPTRGAKRRRAAHAKIERDFEEASQSAYERLCARARERSRR